jgi:O-antigen ligase
MFIMIASFVAVILSLSRSGWIALSTGYIGLLWFTRHQDVAARRRGKAIGVIVLSGIVVATWLNSNGSYIHYEVIVDRMQSIVDDSDPSVSNRDRLDLAKDAVAGILRHPVGVGVGNSAFALGRPIHLDGHAENAWLTIGLEGGWLALAAFSLLFFWLFLSIRSTVPGQVAPPNDLSSAIGVALVVAIFSYLMFNYELNSLFLWSVLAVAWGTKWRERDAINWKNIGSDGGVQCAGHNRRSAALDSGADPSSGRNNHCQ